MRVVATVVILCVLASSEGALAQQRRLVLKGERLRISGCAVDVHDLSVCSNQLVGTVVLQKLDSLILKGERDLGALAVSVDAIQSLHVSNGRKSRTVVGALVGGGTGLLVGLIVGEAEAQQCRSENQWFCDIHQPGWGVLGLLAGAVLGGTVGYFIKTERWEEVPVDRLRVRPLVSANGRSGLVVSVRF